MTNEEEREFIEQFVDEAKEHLAILNRGFLTLEKSPDEEETLKQVFRSAHTIKGSSDALSLDEICQLAHKLEDVLDALRQRKIQTSNEVFNILFGAVDMLNEMVALTKEGHEITIDSSKVCDDLKRAELGQLTTTEGKPTAEEPATAIEQESSDMWGIDPVVDPEEMIPKSSTRDDAKEEISTSITPITELSAGKKEEAVKANSTPTTPITKPSAGKKEGETKVKSKPKETIRIQTDKLDRAINISGEILSLNSQLNQQVFNLEKLEKQILQLSADIKRYKAGIPSSSEEPKGGDFSSIESVKLTINHLMDGAREAAGTHEFLTNELRERVLSLRMQPLSTILDSFPRTIRDLCTSHGKQVDLIIEGDDTELDKKIIEKISDPLLHIIRNCFDHGIESPEDRIQAGKPEQGTIKILACYESGNVLIEISDDGAGIQREMIKEKALRKRMFDEATLDTMSDTDLISLIFRAGFSTNALITNISGRGVGMDVVKENIVEHLKGSVNIESEEGKGTRFQIRLPITLAIMPVFYVAIANLKVAIPLNVIDEVLKVPKEEIISIVNNRAIRHREQIIPIFDLRSALNLIDKTLNGDRLEETIVILSMGREKMAFLIDSVIRVETTEILSLPDYMPNLGLSAGATVFERDHVVTLLHIPRIFAMAKEVKNGKIGQKQRKVNAKTLQILVIDDSISTRGIEKSILEAHGYKVELAYDGMDGWEKAKDFQYDLVVTDVEMPRLDGFSLTEKLRKKKEYEQTPIIIVTSRDNEEDKRRGIQVGADAYIVKGNFRQSSLVQTVKSLIG